MAREILRSYVDRLTAPNLLPWAESQIYREAVAMGFDRQALKQVVCYAKMDRADALEAWFNLELYMKHSGIL